MRTKHINHNRTKSKSLTKARIKHLPVPSVLTLQLEYGNGGVNTEWLPATSVGHPNTATTFSYYTYINTQTGVQEASFTIEGCSIDAYSTQAAITAFATPSFYSVTTDYSGSNIYVLQALEEFRATTLVENPGINFSLIAEQLYYKGKYFLYSVDTTSSEALVSTLSGTAAFPFPGVPSIDIDWSVAVTHTVYKRLYKIYPYDPDNPEIQPGDTYLRVHDMFP